MDVGTLLVAYSYVNDGSGSDSRLTSREVHVVANGTVYRQFPHSPPQRFAFDEAMMDTVVSTEVARLEASALPFVRGKYGAHGGDKNFRGPLFFIGMSGLITYLLYAVRIG